ncbi:CopY family transcriptional regulator [Streptomyces zinciresistens K42]|uniref:CopY family transcriptional regulator n=1 Tax=Streptomyces zinciresistens K42 TaxID=700597 RepID=G2G5Y5_9ACTN|nr:CopY family transcriptional regulator [Streptomyces zinciresistens K42]
MAVVLGALEGEVMRVCWGAEKPVTVRQVLDELNTDRTQPLAYTTVMTVMSRLAEKGVLNRAPQGRGYAYTPAVADEAALAVREVLRAHGDAAVARFAAEAALDPGLRDRLLRLLEESS